MEALADALLAIEWCADELVCEYSITLVFGRWFTLGSRTVRLRPS